MTESPPPPPEEDVIAAPIVVPDPHASLKGQDLPALFRLSHLIQFLFLKGTQF